MNIFFPIAGIHLNLFMVLGLGGAVGLLSGLFGVGGGFIMTPLLMMIGVPPAVAAASDSNQIVAASVSGATGHSRLGNVDWKLGLLLVAGGLSGGWVGTHLVHQLRTIGSYNHIVKLVYVVMLLVVGCYMFYESMSAMFRKNETSKREKTAKTPLLARLPGRVHFKAAGMDASVYGLVGLGFLTGVLAALMGVGGGFIMLPVLIYLIGVPTIIAIGTSLVTVLFTCIEVTFMQSVVNHTVDLLLAVVLLVGSSLGAQIGLRLCRLLRGDQLRVIFSLIVLVMMGKMVHDLMLPAAVHAVATSSGIVSTQTAGSFGNYISVLAKTRAVLYGTVAVLVALLAGLGMNSAFVGIESMVKSLSRRKVSGDRRKYAREEA